MSLPSDISLSSTAKYFGMVESNHPYNINWDVVWSFTYSLSGEQHGICTFLTTNPSLTGSFPGHYMGYYGLSGVLGIAFDSTGYFALSTPIRSGVGLSNIKKNSLVIRDSLDHVVFNEALSSLNTDFVLASSVDLYKTLRFRYCNAGTKLYVDYKNPSSEFINLTAISINSLIISDDMLVYAGVSYSSPVSGLNIYPSTLHLQNFHTQGNPNTPTYEILNMIPLTGAISNNFTTLSGISASPYY